jgi:hypothetical protein
MGQDSREREEEEDIKNKMLLSAMSGTVHLVCESWTSPSRQRAADDLLVPVYTLDEETLLHFE